MENFYLRNKDKIWFVLVSVFLTWVVGKILDSILIRINVGTFLNKIIWFLDYKVSVLSVFLSVTFSVFIFRMWRFVKVKRRRFKVIKATYGAGNHWLDITNELNDAVFDNKLSIVMSNNIAGDPLYGHQKSGKITYEYDGEKFERTFIEGQVIVLPNTQTTSI